MEQHRVWLHISGVGLTAGANEAFAPDAHRWIAVAWLITFRLGPKNRRTEVLVSPLGKAWMPRPSIDVSTRFSHAFGSPRKAWIPVAYEFVAQDRLSHAK